MKKIFDWTVGSFFRTIGRAIAFFVMAMLVYCLLSYNDIDFGIKNLFFDNVKAETTDYMFYYYSKMGLHSSPESITSNIATDFYTYSGIFTLEQIGNVYYHNRNAANGAQTRLYEKLGFCLENGVQFTRAVKNSSLQTASNFAFSVNNTNQICYYQNGGTYEGHMSYLYIAHDVISTSCNTTENYCYIDIDNYIGIQMNNQNSYSIRLLTQQYGYDVQDFDNNDVLMQQFIQQQQATTNAINSQTQQQQQQHQETMNSSTTDAENDASSFFGNFTVEDQGGLSAIVTAPLNTIRSLLSSTCADLVLPLPFVEEDLTLPCMYSIYTQHFGAFFSLYQTIILGIIAYRCIMSIFFDIKGFTNPNDDRIEVMDL